MENRMQTAEKKKSGKGKVIAVIAVIAAAAVGAGLWYSGTVFGISKDEAGKIARDQVKGAENQVQVMVSEAFDDMQKIYDVQFIYDNTVYTFEIAARNGKVIGSEIEPAAVPQQPEDDDPNAGTESQRTDIGAEKAEEIALQKVNGASENDVVKTVLDSEDGIQVYEVEIRYDGMEYDFGINAATGVIVEQSSESVFD